MIGIGEMLLSTRLKWGLTLREVEKRSTLISEKWGRPSFKISASWLNRIEREGRGLSFAKFVVLAVVYGMRLDQLLELCPPELENGEEFSVASAPNRTLLLSDESLESQARSWLPDSVVLDSIPAATALLDPRQTDPSCLKRGIIGQLDKTMSPMIRPGSIVMINTQLRAIAHRREWTHEFDRPIYFLFARTGYFCGWCELDINSEWLTLMPHSLSYETPRRWRHRKEVEVIGRVTGVFQRFDAPLKGSSRFETLDRPR